MKERFAGLTSEACQNLLDEKIEKSRVVQYLGIISAGFVSDEMKVAETMTKLITEIVNQACSWFNYYIIKLLINHFKLASCCKMLAEYEKHINEFAKQHLPPTISSLKLGYVNEMSTCRELVIKVDREWESITFAELERLHNKFASDLFEVEKQNLYLAHVDMGCIKLTFMIPQSVANKLSRECHDRLSHHKKQMLIKERVIHVSCEMFEVFNYCQQNEDSNETCNKLSESWEQQKILAEKKLLHPDHNVPDSGHEISLLASEVSHVF